MLYIFAGHNGLRIAWDGAAPRRTVESRRQQLDTRTAKLRFIRTLSAG